MCLMLYLGSDRERPTIEWQEETPEFYVQAANLQHLDEAKSLDAATAVKDKFSKRFVYYVGSDEGCGCGFRRDGFWFEDDEEVIRRTNKNQQQLFDYAGQCLSTEASIEIYACWAGNESEPAQKQREIKVNQLLEKDFYFVEDELIVIKY